MTAIVAPAVFREASRELGVTASLEKRLLLWLAARIPRSVGSDHLTALGFIALLATGALYAASARWPWLLLAVNAALVVNWFGDSLDGTLARYRERTRPRFGFYVDHLLDSVGVVALVGGLALSGLMRPAVAVAVVVAYLLMSIEVFLATYTVARFKIAYGGIGGTELRIALALANVAVLTWPGPLPLLGLPLFDLLGSLAAGGLAVSMVASALRNGRQLYTEERLSPMPVHRK